MPVNENGMQEIGTTYVYRYPQCRYVSFIRTIFGLITIVAIFGTAFNFISTSKFYYAPLFVCFGIPVLLLELGFLKTFCGSCVYLTRVIICRQDGVCCRMWFWALKLDSWKRAIFYIILSIPCYAISDMVTLFTVLTGISLDTTAILYAVKPWQYQKAVTYVVDSWAPTTQTSSVASMHDPSMIS